MKIIHLISFLATVFFEGVVTLIFLLGMRFEAGRGNIINYATLRLGLTGVLFTVLAALLMFVIAWLLVPKRANRLLAFLDVQLAEPKKRLFFVQGALIVAAVFLFEFFLLTYLAFPIPAATGVFMDRDGLPGSLGSITHRLYASLSRTTSLGCTHQVQVARVASGPKEGH